MQPSVNDEQDKILDEAIIHINQLSGTLRRAIDDQNYRDVIRTASLIVSELRTSSLSAQNYFSLYMAVTNELRYVEQFLEEESKKGRSMNDYYLYVQRIANIVPRLYLLITVGSVYMKTGEAPINTILKDLLELCKGVQHPMRGLFVRSYLLQMSKDYLPNSNTSDSRHGDIEDSVSFVLANFVEMTKLWVRIQHLPLDIPTPNPKRTPPDTPQEEIDRLYNLAKSHALEKRRKERLDLRVLIGHNFNVLTHLEGLDHVMYSSTVLPQVLKQIVQSKDAIAQQYLLECLTFAFSDDLHLRTLDTFLSTCASLQKEVDVNSIISQYLLRLAEFASKNPNDIPSLSTCDDVSGAVRDRDLFDTFSEHVDKIRVERKEFIGPSDVISLADSLLSVVFKCFPDRHDYVDRVISTLPQHSSEMGNVDVFRSSSTISRQALSLLKRPVDEYKNLYKISKLADFYKAMSLLPSSAARQLARALAESTVASKTCLVNVDDSTPELVKSTVDATMSLLRPLYLDKEVDQEDMTDDAVLFAKLIHCFKGQIDADIQVKFCEEIFNNIKNCGDVRLAIILPALVSLSLHAAELSVLATKNEEREVGEEEEESQGEEHDEEQVEISSPVDCPCKNALRHAIEYCRLLTDVNPKLTLSLLVQVALYASKYKQGNISYDAMAECLLIFEREPMGDSSCQLNMFKLIIATLMSLKLSSEYRLTLANKATHLHSQLLLRPDQCSALVLCSHLFEGNDEDRVVDVLKKSLKIADKCMEVQVDVALLVAILERYLYHYERTSLLGVAKITPAFITSILTLIASNLSEDPSGHVHFDLVRKHIAVRKSEGKYVDFYSRISIEV
ncbi:hypothetical protein RCL1_008697 [Eukaryota sp. TZLM3-RCL]